MSGDLTRQEREAAAWAVTHLIDKHGYSSILDGKTLDRVGLEGLRTKLLDMPEDDEASVTASKEES